MGYVFHLLILFEVYLVVAIGANVIVGYLGLLTLAHAGYFAVGAYVYALTSMLLGWNFIAASAAAVAMATLLSLPLSIAAWRFRGDFFVMISLAVQVAIHAVLKNWHDTRAPLGSWSNMTNGDFGIIGVKRPSIFGHVFQSPLSVAILYSILVLLVILGTHRLLTSPWSRLVTAVRDDELAAKGLGKDIRLLKMQGVALGCGLAGLAGAMFASYNAFVDPKLASLDQSTLFLAMIIVGGLGGSIVGPICGALVLILLPEALRFVDFPLTFAAEMRLAIYGILLILLMQFRPRGIAGKFRME